VSPFRRYAVELGSCFLAYAGLLWLSLTLLRRDLVPPAWQVPIALPPMLPGIAMVWAVLRQLRRMDELQRRLQLEALAFAYCGTALTTFSYGFLEHVGFSPVSMWAVWPLMGVLWVVGQGIGAWRYW